MSQSDWDRRGETFDKHPVATSTYVAALCAIGLVALAVVCWQVGWFFKTNDAKRQGTLNTITSHNYIKNYGYQQTQREAVASDMQQIQGFPAQMIGQGATERSALGAQRANDLIQLCIDAGKVDSSQGPLPQAAFIAANCANGAANPTSPYVIHPDQPNP